ncbi:MAG: glycosyltransferase family 4 protein [Candidatus Competibacteraceae bacterium]|nr:MAG: glycosyltransferase family 4 protein [Candidatus Competibacteraceae bacterium]
MKRSSLPLRVLILQPVIPTYRKRVFEILSASSDPVFTIIAGDHAEGLRTLQGAELDQIRHHLVAPRNIRFGGHSGFTWHPEAWRLVRREQPDCVIVQGSVYDITSWLVLLWGRWCNVPVLSWTIGLQRSESGPKWWFRRAFYNLARGLLLYGDYPKRLLTDGGVPADRIHVIYNSLDVSAQRAAEAMVREEDVQQLREKLGIAAGAFVLLFIGRIVPRKRLSISLHAITALAAQGYDVHLLLIGDGDDVDNLHSLSLQLATQRKVHFVGAIYDEIEIAKYMKLSAAALIPEAGLPIIHPMGYGLPPIISDNLARHGTEWEAVEEGQTGFFYCDNDIDSLITVIKKCLLDDEMRLIISKNARRRAVERYTSEQHAARIIEGVLRFTRRD